MALSNKEVASFLGLEATEGLTNKWFTREPGDGVVYRYEPTGPHTSRIVVVARGCSVDEAKEIATAHNTALVIVQMEAA